MIRYRKERSAKLMELKFSTKPVNSLGRNGTSQTIGVMVERGLSYDNDVKILTLWPINSRNTVTRCFIEIPIADAKKLINAIAEQIASL